MEIPKNNSSCLIEEEEKPTPDERLVNYTESISVNIRVGPQLTNTDVLHYSRTLTLGK